MADRPLDGRVALITGAGSSMGMGREMALALAESGARVALMDIDAEQLERNVNDAREIGGDGCALPIVGSVNSWDDAQRAVSETIAGLGGLHIVINNAACRAATPAGSGSCRPRCGCTRSASTPAVPSSWHEPPSVTCASRAGDASSA